MARRKMKRVVARRFARVLQDEPVFVENGVKGLFGLALAFGWLHLSQEVLGQLLFVMSFLLGLYARMTVTPLSRPKAKTGDRLVTEPALRRSVTTPVGVAS